MKSTSTPPAIILIAESVEILFIFILLISDNLGTQATWRTRINEYSPSF